MARKRRRDRPTIVLEKINFGPKTYCVEWWTGVDQLDNLSGVMWFETRTEQLAFTKWLRTTKLEWLLKISRDLGHLI